jgi:hypothetical protein
LHGLCRVWRNWGFALISYRFLQILFLVVLGLMAVKWSSLALINLLSAPQVMLNYFYLKFLWKVVMLFLFWDILESLFSRKAKNLRSLIYLTLSILSYVTRFFRIFFVPTYFFVFFFVYYILGELEIGSC